MVEKSDHSLTLNRDDAYWFNSNIAPSTSHGEVPSYSQEVHQVPFIPRSAREAGIYHFFRHACPKDISACRDADKANQGIQPFLTIFCVFSYLRLFYGEPGRSGVGAVLLTRRIGQGEREEGRADIEKAELAVVTALP